MRRYLSFIMIAIVIVILSACKPNTNSQIDCDLDPTNEECLAIIDCEETPEHPTCNIEYDFEDSYAILDIENDTVDAYEDMITLMSEFIVANSDLFSFANDYYFEQFASVWSNYIEGMDLEKLNNYPHAKDILLDSIDNLNMSISSDVAKFVFNPTEGDYVEGTVVDAVLNEEYTGKSSFFVNEDGFQYLYEIVETINPSNVVSYYKMTLVVTISDRLVYEIVQFSDDKVSNFDYFYLLYDSKVGYVVKDLSLYEQNFEYFANQVNLKDGTSELAKMQLGSNRLFDYSLFDYDEKLYYQKAQSVSQIGEQFVYDTVSFYDEYEEVVSLDKTIELVTTGMLPTTYDIAYNIAYLNGWDIVYGDYIVANNSEVAYVSTKDLDSVSVPYLVVNKSLEQDFNESDFLEPFDNISFNYIGYSDILSEMNRIYAMNSPVFYENNIATVKGIDYDVRTELLDLFTSDLESFVEDRVLDYMIVDSIVFEGDTVLIPIINCEVEPDNALCPIE